jgi:cell pole-organizing protein PopZ
MEEILASIRQIIESNEPGAGRGISAALPPVYETDDEEEGRDSNIRLTVDDAYADVEFPEPVMRSDPRFVAANSAGSAPEPEAPARAMSLADVAARVRAASERNAVQQPLREVPEAFRQPEVRVTAEAQRPMQEALRPVEAAPAPASVAAPAETVVAAAPLEELPPTVAEIAPEPQAVRPPAPVMEAPASAEERFLPSVLQEAQQTLLSQDAGLQIARSFEELAAAVDGAERRSLGEIAEDMLRPMLRDWLDDNLPTLVERLVREEIERVARGPRR